MAVLILENPTNGGYNALMLAAILEESGLFLKEEIAMNTQRVLVVSGQPLISQGLKLIIEGAVSTEVTTVSDEKLAADLMAELTPGVVVVDRTEADETDLDCILFGQDYPAKLVVISPNDDRMVVYSREKVHSATMENLLDTIRGNTPSSNGSV